MGSCMLDVACCMSFLIIPLSGRGGSSISGYYNYRRQTRPPLHMELSYLYQLNHHRSEGGLFVNIVNDTANIVHGGGG
jgi:hypothetical protein